MIAGRQESCVLQAAVLKSILFMLKREEGEKNHKQCFFIFILTIHVSMNIKKQLLASEPTFPNLLKSRQSVGWADLFIFF